MYEVVTISRNKITGDRSYTHAVYKIIAQNDTHYKVRQVRTTEEPEIPSYWDKPHFLLKDEYELTPAANFL